MASWLATGPCTIVCEAPSTVVTWVEPCRFWMTPWEANTIARTNDIGSRIRRMPRVRSTQKFPMVARRRRTSDRIRAMATVRPTAADTKFCTARPAIWVSWDTVDSPE